MMSDLWGLGNAAPAPHQFLTMNSKVYALRFQEDFGDVSIKQVDLLNEVEVSKVYHCDGLVLCVAKDKDNELKLLLWNPYLSQTRAIGPRESFNIQDRHALGYDDDDSNKKRRNHKILRIVTSSTLGPERKLVVGYEIYDIRSDSWRVLDVVNPEGSMDRHRPGVSVKGNAYFFATDNITRNIRGYIVSQQQVFLICFDFTKERFGPRLPLPFDSFNGFNGDLVTLSSFHDDEQLAVLFGGFESGFFEIWVTLTVDPDRASWSRFLRMEPGPFCCYGFRLYSSLSSGSFVVDEANKVAVLFELDVTETAHKAFVFGQDGYFKSSFNLGSKLEHRSPTTNLLHKAARPPLVCSSSYRPSLVQVNQPLLVPKRKRMSRLPKRKRMSPSFKLRMCSLVRKSKGMSPPTQ